MENSVSGSCKEAFACRTGGWNDQCLVDRCFCIDCDVAWLVQDMPADLISFATVRRRR